MRGSFGAIQRPVTRTNVGRFVVEKNPSGRTPSAGAGAKRASGKLAKAGWEKSGGENVVLACNLCARLRQSLGRESAARCNVEV